MIELLVTLVLLGLISALVIPGMDAWLKSRELSSQELSLSAGFAMLPIKAANSGKSIVISSAADLNLQGIELEIEQPIIIDSNGYCHRGQLKLSNNGVKHLYNINSPFCELERAQLH
ncbi:hypothetical protein H8B19_03555 [Neptunicella marina]|uniref:Uncharacterized protein n=2 Tax=Neptunicella marina TaxID=2125989 RepID=A0A8J6IT40_9ALTE|nr:hypothetical protein [Neptunicella marina]